MKSPRYLSFWLFLAALVVVSVIVTPLLGPARAILAGFDLGAGIFIAMTVWRMRGAGTDDMRERAKVNDPDHRTLLLFALLIVGAVLVAVGVELTGTGGSRGGAIALAGATLLLAWLFSNLLFALHYAHRFYSSGDDGGDNGGLEFPGDDEPDYGDFAYFAFVLGMTFQVSDVDITAKPMRRLALFHGIVAFLFNIVVVALSVSLIGNLLK